MIDQTRLPRETVYVTCRDYREVADAIRTMIIRGAPAIGVAAAMGVALGASKAQDLESEMPVICETLAKTTAYRRESLLGDRPHAKTL